MNERIRVGIDLPAVSTYAYIPEAIEALTDTTESIAAGKGYVIDDGYGVDIRYAAACRNATGEKVTGPDRITHVTACSDIVDLLVSTEGSSDPHIMLVVTTDVVPG